MGRSAGIEVNDSRQEPLAYGLLSVVNHDLKNQILFLFVFVNPVGGYFYRPFLGIDFMAFAIFSEFLSAG